MYEYWDEICYVAAGCVMILVLGAVGAMVADFGGSLVWMTATLLTLSFGACVAIAACDSTRRAGYCFGAVMACSVAGAVIGLDTVRFFLGILLGAAHLAVMWAIYAIRRHRDGRREPAELGLQIPSHINP